MRKIACMVMSLVWGTVAFANTIDVTEFRYAGPYTLLKPLMVDTVDVHSKAFDVKSFLDTDLSFSVLEEASLVSADALPATSDGYALHLAGFVIDNQMYAEADLKVEGVDTYKVYVDGNKQEGGKLKLEPASHTIVIKYLSESGKEGKPKVSLTTSKDDLLTLNTTGKRMYTLMDVVTGTRIGETEISADGKYLITSYRISKVGGQSDRFTCVTEIATGKIVAERSETLHWMPSSVRYYFTRETTDRKQLVTVDPATGTESVWIDKLPDGFFQIAPTEDFLLYSIREKGPEERKDVYEVLVPDDRQPGWRERSNLYKLDVATGLMQQLTFGFHNVRASSISNDGRYVIFSVSKDRLTQRPTTLSSLYKLDLQTLEAELLVEDDGFIRGGSFSPDDTQLLISGSPESFNGIGMNVKEGQTPNEYDGQLFLMNLADKNVTPLTKYFNPSVERTVWSKVDNNIYFFAENRDRVDLFRMDGKTHKIEQINVAEELIKGISLANAAPVLAFYGESASNSERLYTLNTKTLKSTLIRDLHAEQMSEIAFGECNAWDYVNSRGDTICGRYYLPPHFDPSKKYPLIVNYYGGCSPTSRNFESRYPHHAYAALGYVVYIVEPSGATGFGQEFSARHVNTAGKYVADDIIEGTKKFCEEHSFINTEKIGCIGASYGGFMTQYLQTQTDIFAAAISHAGISDHTSYWGEGYWGYSYSEVSMANSYPWQNKDLYVDQSPLYNADKIHTPLLFLHGDADHNVPVGESIQMYTALKLLGRETAMVLVKDQDHHILEYGKRARWQATIFAWFAKYLQDDDSWWESMYPKKSL